MVRTARWSLPVTSCTSNVSAVMPSVEMTWSICGPRARIRGLGPQVGTRPAPRCSAASAHPAVPARSAEWSSVALKSPATTAGVGPVHHRDSNARSLFHSGTDPGTGATEWNATKRSAPSPPPVTST